MVALTKTKAVAGHLHLVLLHHFHDGAEEGHPAVLDLRLPLFLI